MKSQFYRRRNRGSVRPGGLPKGTQLFSGTAGIQAHSSPESVLLAAMINSSSEVNSIVERKTYF